MTTVRLTMADALVRHLVAQRTLIDGVECPLVAGVFAIFGHGNVTCLGPALHDAGETLPTWRGQNEQGMALAAIGYTKAMRRRQVMAVATSVGPGALNMVTAAGVAMANRLPVLLLASDTFQHRRADPVLQQIEQFAEPATTVNDAFRPVVRYWDRIGRAEQLITSLPNAIATMLDPATCGPVFLALPQDVQGETADFPTRWFEPVVHEIARPRPDRGQVERAATALRSAQRPVIVAGGGVHYSLAEDVVARFAERRGIPILETVAGKSTVTADHPLYAGPVGVVGSDAANALAAQADVVLAIGTRLQDFTTGSGTVFSGPGVQLIGVNTARFDAVKHGAIGVVGDAAETVRELEAALGEWTAPAASSARVVVTPPVRVAGNGAPSYAEVVAAVSAWATDRDYVVAAAGGFPGELNVGWPSKAVATFDCEYGFSCMGYEISGGWGAAMARSQLVPGGATIVFVGDGSYLMLNSDLLSSVLSGHPMVVILCDNGGFAVIDRLQVAQGGAPFNNLWDDVRTPGERVRVDFVAHATALGCHAELATTADALHASLARARTATRTTVIVVPTDPHAWTPGGAWWEVGAPGISDRPTIAAASAAIHAQRTARGG
ncbi:MAG: 3D-(3,5/4)-trihydroxycyclohexane-1,2-dione acylhydrolase (decyclizing) [Ilumatobacteraceae bacterium]